ncbi:hypothetical protein PVNG_00925 [Plasmodium vivax North Korean]|uniref:RSE1/DDB1/CPSF1 C-terminal domain-containing protein n=1 Tax=Plasmodium vivax North Korean TaxID=1035514 RepID=A0A0J9TTG6_PLAVI|nr:hypothetical protein PVNG_00925 [Plasmodium vivax North Korean]
MINLQVHQLRSPSEADHCACGNLLREKSLEFVLVKNKNLSIYSYQRKRKKILLLYETKLNAPVVKLIILKDVFLRKNKERISGVLLVYKGIHFILYRFTSRLNTLVVVLKHSFLKKANFQPLFYSLPIAVNYVHRYDKGGGSAAGRTIRIGGRKPVTGLTRRRRFRLAAKRLKGGVPALHRGIHPALHPALHSALHPALRPALHPALHQEGEPPEQEVPTKKRREKGRRRRATPVGESREPPQSELNLQSGADDDVYVDLYGERGGSANLDESFWLDGLSPEGITTGSANRQPPRNAEDGQSKTKKRISNFCEFAVAFTNDFKTIYILFYSSRRRSQKGLDPTCAGELRTTRFGKGLHLFNVVRVSLQDLYRHFIFIKRIFFHGGNIHVLLQNEPINVGHAALEEPSLKLLILRQEDNQFDANKLTKGVPNDTIDLLRVKELLICLGQDYLYVVNLKKNQKESSSNLWHRRGKLFILSRRCIIEGTLSSDRNNLVKLLKWRKVHTFKYDLAKSSVCCFGGRVHFLCCYNGLCGRADVDLLVRRVKPNDNFLMDLLTYLNRNPSVNEHTKGLNHSKYNFLFQKHKKKVSILEGNFSFINAQGGVEYVPPLFILRRRKKRREKGGAPLRIGSTTNRKAITRVAKIPAKGMITDLIKSKEEPSLVHNSSYFALIGCKQHSSVEKIFFKVPFSILLSISFAGASLKGVCASEGGRRGRLSQYVMINLEGGKPQQGAEGGTKNGSNDGRSYGDGGGSGPLRRSLLLCVDGVNTWRQRKGAPPKGTPLSEKGEGLVVDPTSSTSPQSKEGNPLLKGTLLSNRRGKVIYTLRGDGAPGEPSDQVGLSSPVELSAPVELSSQVEFPPTGTAKVDAFLAFFKLFPFVHFSSGDVERYLEGKFKGDRESEGEPDSKSDSKSEGKPESISNGGTAAEMELKQKCAHFFLVERKKSTHLRMDGTCVALLRFKRLLLQVCRNQINVCLYANTCILLRHICVEDAVVECKLVSRFLILRHESGSCSVYSFHEDAVADLLLRVEGVTSLLNMCVLRCLDVGNREEEINLLRFAALVRGRAPSQWSYTIGAAEEDTERETVTEAETEDLLSLFQTKTPDSFCEVINRMGGQCLGEIISLHTQLSNVHCISTVRRGTQSLLAFLYDANCSLCIFHLERRRTLFRSNALLAVPKYVYNAGGEKREKGAKREERAKHTKRMNIAAAEGEAPPGELTLEAHKLEEVINVLLFPLGPNYILTVFLTGRPILIYKSIRQVRSISRLKFQVVPHRYTQPLLSNVHYVKSPSGEDVRVVTVSRDRAEPNNGFVLYVDGGKIDGRKRGGRTKEEKATLQMKKKKKKPSKCIVGYPHVDLSRVDLSHVSGSEAEQLYQKVRAYDAAFPPLLLSNCRGKLFIHRFDGGGEVAAEGSGPPKESGPPEERQPKSIVQIDRNAFLRVDAAGLHIVSLGEGGNVCAGGPHQVGRNERDGRSDPHQHHQSEWRLNRDVARTLGEASPPLEVTCLHSSVDAVQVHKELLLLRSPPPNELCFNDDFVSKLLLSYPYVSKIAVSQFEYVLRRGKGGEKRGEKRGKKKGEKKGEKEGQTGDKQTGLVEGENEDKQTGEVDWPPAHGATRGKVICAVVRVKYDEYHCLKKLQKRRLNLQKDELRSNVAYAGEEVQCVPNVHLQDSINNQYTHKLNRFLRGDDEEVARRNDEGDATIRNGEEVARRNDEEVARRNSKPISSAKTHAKFSKLLLLHEGSQKRAYGYYTFEHSEEVHCVSFGCLQGREYIYVGTSLNIGERVETQGNIYVFDLGGVFARAGGGEKGGNVGVGVGGSVNGGVDVNGLAEPPRSGTRRTGKLPLYMKKTYNSSVTQIHPFYVHSEGFPCGGLGSALQSLIRSAGGEVKYCGKYCGKYSGRSQPGELPPGEEEQPPYAHERSTPSGRANQKSSPVDQNVHCNILHCINSKLFIHEVRENDFTKGAFLDSNLFISDIKVMKNFLIVADLYKGIFINMFNYEQQHDSRSIIPIAKPFFCANLNILCCHHIVLDHLICIIAMDLFNNFFIFSFRTPQAVETLYLFTLFNFNRRILKYVDAVHPHRRSNSAVSISNDGSVHLFHPLTGRSFDFFRGTYNVVRASLFPHLALNAHADLTPDVFTQAARLNLHRRTDSFSIKHVLFDDMLRQLPFYSAEVLHELFFKRANLLEHITMGELLIELSSLNER